MQESVIYRNAKVEDAKQIALLHADSWRRTYRGLFTDEFLDKDADSNRINVWNSRLNENLSEQLVFVAESDGNIAGFVCAYGKEDADWGSLVDNLHVAPAHQRQGVGTQLMQQVFSWRLANYPKQSLYLWVMENNQKARRFYEKLGATNTGVVVKPNPVGG